MTERLARNLAVNSNRVAAPASVRNDRGCTVYHRLIVEDAPEVSYAVHTLMTETGCFKKEDPRGL